MAAYDWSTTHGALLSGLGAVSGELATRGAAVAAALERAGNTYDARRNAIALDDDIDAVEGAWATAAESAWNAAGGFARAALPAPAPAYPVFDVRDDAAMLAFLAQAQAKVPLRSVVGQALSAARTTLSNLWDPNRTYPAGDGLDLYLTADYYTRFRQKRHESLRTLELAAFARAQDAQAWLDALALV